MIIFIKSKHYMVIQMMIMILVIRMCVYIYMHAHSSVYVCERVCDFYRNTLVVSQEKKGNSQKYDLSSKH
jgi:hypothetical protein